MTASASLVAALSGLTPAELALPARFGAVADVFRVVGKEQGVDPAVLAAVAWSESGFDLNVVNSIGATGLMQIMPANFARYGIAANPTDPIGNVRAGALDLIAKGLKTRRFKDVMRGYNGLVSVNDPAKVAAFETYYSRITGRWAWFALSGTL